MEVVLVRKQLASHVASMFNEGYLDEQFAQLQKLQDSESPTFVSDVISLFSKECERIINELRRTLDRDPNNFKKLNEYIHQLKGSSSSIGALRIKTTCMNFHILCERESNEGCSQALRFLEREFLVLKSKLETMLKMEQKIVAIAGADTKD